jgi:hypothetical protein
MAVRRADAVALDNTEDGVITELRLTITRPYLPGGANADDNNDGSAAWTPSHSTRRSKTTITSTHSPRP